MVKSIFISSCLLFSICASSAPSIQVDPQKDYFAILEISKDADLESIKTAYRKLALRWHPDKNGDSEESTKKFQEIKEAYEILSSPTLAAKVLRCDEDIACAESIDAIIERLGSAKNISQFQRILNELKPRLGGWVTNDHYKSFLRLKCILVAFSEKPQNATEELLEILIDYSRDLNYANELLSYNTLWITENFHHDVYNAIGNVIIGLAKKGVNGNELIKKITKFQNKTVSKEHRNIQNPDIREILEIPLPPALFDRILTQQFLEFGVISGLVTDANSAIEFIRRTDSLFYGDGHSNSDSARSTLMGQFGFTLDLLKTARYDDAFYIADQLVRMDVVLVIEELIRSGRIYTFTPGQINSILQLASKWIEFNEENSYFGGSTREETFQMVARMKGLGLVMSSRFTKMNPTPDEVSSFRKFTRINRLEALLANKFPAKYSLPKRETYSGLVRTKLAEPTVKCESLIGNARD